MATSSAAAFAGGGGVAAAAASRSRGHHGCDTSDGGRRFPRVVPYTRTTAFLFEPTAANSLISFSSPRRKITGDPTSSRQTEPSDFFMSSTAEDPSKSMLLLSPPEGTSVALYCSSHLAEPFLMQGLTRTRDGLTATTVERQAPKAGSWHLRGAGRDENTHPHTRHCTLSRPPRPHRCQPAEAPLPYSSGAALTDTFKQTPVIDNDARDPYAPHARLTVPLYRSVATAHSRSCQHCSASTAVAAATERLQTKAISAMTTDVVSTSRSLCMRGGNADAREGDAPPECTSAAVSSLAPSSCSDVSGAQHCGRQRAVHPSAPAHYQQQEQGRLRLLGQRVGEALFLRTVQGGATGTCTCWFSPPPTNPHVNAARIATPFHALFTAVQQKTSPIRDPMLTSSQVRQRPLPREVFSTNSATVTSIVSSRNDFRVEGSVRRRLETRSLTPDNTLACGPVASTHTAHAGASCGIAALVVQGLRDNETAHGEPSPAVSVVSSPSHHLPRTNSLLLSDPVPLLSSRQTSPSLARAGLAYGNVQEDWCFGRPSSSRSLAEEARQKQSLLVARRCRHALREEAAAREWLVLDASLQMHHILCEERAAYRLVEVKQCQRRSSKASAHGGALMGAADSHLTRELSAQLSPSVLPEEVCHLADTPLSTQRLRRAPSASSRPLLSRHDLVPAETHEGDDEKSRLRSFSLSTSLCRSGCLPPRSSKGRDEDGRLHARDVLAGVEEVRWHDAEDKCNPGKEEEASHDAAEGEQEHARVISGCYDTVSEKPTASMLPSYANQRTASLRPARPPSPCHEGHEGRLLARIQDLQCEEEDLRFLLTGDCPPPRVFHRWANRYFEGHQASFSSATADTSQTSVLHPSPSPEAVERCCSRSFSPPIVPPACGAAASALRPPDDSTITRVILTASHGTSRSPLLPAVDEMATKRSDESLPWSEGSSVSRHRLCSEHRRAWTMENILSGEDDYATTNEKRRGGPAQARSRPSPGRSEGNACGRCAPDPRIFSAGQSTAPGSAFTLLSYAALSPSSTARPINVEGATVPGAGDYPQQPLKSTTLGSSSFPKLASPTEKTYSAPLGSERGAWQALMDEFIDGLLQITERE